MKFHHSRRRWFIHQYPPRNIAVRYNKRIKITVASLNKDHSLAGSSRSNSPNSTSSTSPQTHLHLPRAATRPSQEETQRGSGNRRFSRSGRGLQYSALVFQIITGIWDGQRCVLGCKSVFLVHDNRFVSIGYQYHHPMIPFGLITMILTYWREISGARLEPGTDRIRREAERRVGALCERKI